MSRVLLLFSKSSYRAKAFIAAARCLDLDITVGSDHNQALADLTPGSSLILDTIDIDGSVNAITQFNLQYPLSAIVPAEDDFTPLAAAASKELDLTHHPLRAVRSSRNKATMRKRTAESGLPSPWFEITSVENDARTAASKIHYPCVLKPMALSASRGVIRVNTFEEFCHAWERIKSILKQPDSIIRSGGAETDILIEEYLPGHEVIVEGIVTDGRLQTLAILDKPDLMEGPFFEETILTTPSLLSGMTQENIISCVQESIDILGLNNGPIHAELRVQEQKISLLEIAPRSIGGLCSKIIRFQSDITLEEIILRHALGMPTSEFTKAREATGVMMLPIPKAGILCEVKGMQKALKVPGVQGIDITIATGQKIFPLPEGDRYLGFIFAEGEDPAQVENALKVAYGKLKVYIKPF